MEVAHEFTVLIVDQDYSSWLIVDGNETPGGLASTDVTPEGFVSLLLWLAFPECRLIF